MPPDTFARGGTVIGMATETFTYDFLGNVEMYFPTLGAILKPGGKITLDHLVTHKLLSLEPAAEAAVATEVTDVEAEIKTEEAKLAALEATKPTKAPKTVATPTPTAETPDSVETTPATEPTSGA
jgi:hypothetical protein